MSPPIRRAVAADVPALHALIEGAYRGDTARRGWTHEADLLGGPRTTAAAIAAIVADPRQCFLVLPGGDGPAACVQLSDCGGGLAYLGQLAVVPDCQAHGLGRRMIVAAETAAAAFGATRIELTVVDRRPELIAYYRRRGYAETGEIRPFPPELIEDVPLSLVVLGKALRCPPEQPDADRAG